VQDPEHPPQKFSTYKKASTNGGSGSDKRSGMPVVVIEEIAVNKAVCILSHSDESKNDRRYADKIVAAEAVTTV
jgi:hypothetical protein